MPEWLSAEIMLEYLVRLMIVFLIFPLHEFAHAFVAHKLGDDTAKYQGRLTIDPLSHLDPYGALLTFFFGFGWAKPVPVNPANFKHKNFDMMLVAIAGPLTNLLAAVLGMAAIQMCGGFEGFVSRESLSLLKPVAETSGGYLFLMLSSFVELNLSLFLFNLLPVPPLDGSRVLIYFLPPRAAVWFMKYSRIFYGIVFVLMLTGILGIPIAYGNDYLMHFLADLSSVLPVVVTWQL